MSNLSSSTGVGDELYGGAATFGRFMGMINVFVLGFLTLICFIVGLVFLARKETYTETTMATILNATQSPCSAQQKVVNNSSGSTIINYFRCTLQLSYKAKDKDGNDKDYTRPLTIDSDDNYNNNDQIEIKYRPDDPTDIAYKPISPKTIGTGLILASLVLAIIAFFTYYIITRFKFAAAGVGAASVFRWFR